MTYLITFACYGCHLHGDLARSVDPSHNLPGSPALAVDPTRAANERRRMAQQPYHLDHVRRQGVLQAIREVCPHRAWGLLAAHVRTTHVHVVVQAETSPERVMNHLKSYSSRRLNLLNLEHSGRKRWAKHGITRWLWQPAHISAAIEYVIAEQGTPMSVYAPPALQDAP